MSFSGIITLYYIIIQSRFHLSCLNLSRDLSPPINNPIIDLMYFSSFIKALLPNSLQIVIVLNLFIKEEKKHFYSDPNFSSLCSILFSLHSWSSQNNLLVILYFVSIVFTHSLIMLLFSDHSIKTPLLEVCNELLVGKHAILLRYYPTYSKNTISIDL